MMGRKGESRQGPGGPCVFSPAWSRGFHPGNLGSPEDETWGLEDLRHLSLPVLDLKGQPFGPGSEDARP